MKKFFFIDFNKKIFCRFQHNRRISDLTHQQRPALNFYGKITKDFYSTFSMIY